MEEDHNGLQLERIVFFSDAVFAIAITLLIIEIKVPHIEYTASDRDFWFALLSMLPKFLGYFFSFFVIGAYWIGHHRIYGYIVRWNYGLIWRNVFFLMAIAFIPFSTAFMSEYFSRFVPLFVYAMSFSLAGLLQIMQWRYARKNDLIDEAADPEAVAMLGTRMWLLTLVGFVAVGIGLFNPLLAGFGFWLIPIGSWILKARHRRKAGRADVIRDELTEQN
ncbi:MAG TPA: TMEM175 family protein [Pyrinomonadaceae bacterium]|nr:TMEM175 family protein [Pyrinomonadaceae bacterium]